MNVPDVVCCRGANRTAKLGIAAGESGPEVAEQVKQFEADTPMGRMANVDEMVGPAVFLSSKAASFVTGIDLIVDGGFVCW